MHKSIRFALVLAILLAVVLSQSVQASSDNTSIVRDVIMEEETDIPQDLAFSVGNTCLGHAYFKQAVANEDGMCAVFSLHVNPEDPADVNFKKAYIDIYDVDGSFLQELSFITPHTFSMELTDETVNLFFYDSVLIYTLQTQALHRYKITPLSDADSEKLLPAKEFTCGDWTYRCTKGWNGYVQLTRTSNLETQILVDMPGMKRLLWESVFPGLAAAVAITLVGVGIWIKRKKNEGQGDGSVVP